MQKDSGLLIAAKKKYKLVNTTCTPHQNILTGRLMIYNIPVRLIAVYGLQETCSVDDREEFYDELSTEIENCSMYADNPIITGDFNAKIEFQDPDIAHLSANGKCQCHVIEKYSLQVLNFHPKCTGK